MNRVYRFSMVLWAVGTALIVGSWVDVVTPHVGWIGFGVALSGTILSMVSNRVSSEPVRYRPSDLCSSCLLHQSNDCRRPERPYAVTCPDHMKA